jgi:uncharacterized membrane protein
LRALTDKQLEASIASMLRVGVILSAVVVAAGGVLYLRDALIAAPDYAQFHPESPSLRTVVGVLRGVAHLDAASIIQVGIFLLIATPVVRVMFCIVGFARQKDPLYIAISATVLAILTYSLTQGAR